MTTRWGRDSIIFAAGTVATVVSFLFLICTGAVDIPLGEIFSVLGGGESQTPYINTIIMETRLPMAIAAACCGAMLSVAGLMMQTLFQNPLAGPSVLGITSGASFGVALLTLSAGGGAGLLGSSWQPVVGTLGALGGGLLTIGVLYAFSTILKNGVTLLIAGLMISYLCSSGVALLNYFSPADEIRNYLVWGLGSYTGLRLDTAIKLAIGSAIFLLPTLLFIKPLNAMLMGERYLESVGYSARGTRGRILIATGFLVAVPTAFCGPIGFIGLIVPHLCRLLFRTSNHTVLLPASIVFGALVSLACAWIGVVPSGEFGVLPINVVTPIIGVPVILYLLVNREKLPYFA